MRGGVCSQILGMVFKKFPINQPPPPPPPHKQKKNFYFKKNYTVGYGGWGGGGGGGPPPHFPVFLKKILKTNPPPPPRPLFLTFYTFDLTSHRKRDKIGGRGEWKGGSLTIKVSNFDKIGNNLINLA